MEHAKDAERYFTNIHDVLITALCMLHCMYLAPVVFRFMIVGYLHYSRQLAAQMALVDAVKVHHVVDIGEPVQDLKMLELTKDHNLFVWSDLRTIIHFFGHDVANRISFNTGATIVVVSIFVVLLLQQALAGVRDWKLMCFIAVVFVVLVALSLSTFIVGAQLNGLDGQVVTLLRGEVLQLDNIRDRRGAESEAAVRKNQAMLANLAEYLRFRRETHPIKVMYMPASASLVSALIGGVFTGLLVFLQIAVNGVKV